MKLEFNRIGTALLVAVLIGVTACGHRSDERLGRDGAPIGTPGCPDCTDPCELEDTASELRIFGRPVEAEPPILSITARLESSTHSCERAVDPAMVTIVPSEDDWSTESTACAIVSPTRAELEIEDIIGTTILTCRIHE